MGLRFNRRFTILPGVHINVGTGGASLSVGPRGASVNIGRRGVHANVGVPGTGLSYRARLDGGASAGPDRSSRGADRAALLEALIQEVERRSPHLDRVHLDTPALPARPVFDQPRPVGDVSALMAWRAAKANFENGLGIDAETTGALVERSLRSLAWHRRTEIAFRVDDEGRGLTIDVDLPEIEDLPGSEPAVDRRALRIVERPLTAKRRQDVYAMHVAGIAFRLLGAAFAAAPGIREVRLSVYTTREVGGAASDDYVAAGCVTRENWSALSLVDLADLDVENAVRRLGIRMERTGRGALATIEPCA